MIHKSNKDVIKNVKLGDDICFNGFNNELEGEIITGYNKDTICINYGIVQKKSDYFTIEKFNSFEDSIQKINLSKAEIEAIIKFYNTKEVI